MIQDNMDETSFDKLQEEADRADREDVLDNEEFELVERIKKEREAMEKLPAMTNLVY